jgi:Na+/H+-dicarboxylate symporter
VQVLIAIALGVLLGVVYPSLASDVKPFSDGFITLIRAVVPPITFATVAVDLTVGGERFMSEIRTVTNLFSNIFATIVSSKWMGELKDRQLQLVLDGRPGDLRIEEPELVG